MKVIESLYKATMEAKRALELPGMIRQTGRILDDKVREFDALVEDSELELLQLRTELAEADKSDKGRVFAKIVEKKIEIEEAKKIADIAKEEKAALWAEVSAE
jgi:hypothetical protein